jgi:DnaJ-class molecular chaperone
MDFITCDKCHGEGYVKDPDILADAEDTVECEQCGASGLIEKMPF